MDNFSFAKSAFANILEITKSNNEAEKDSSSRLLDMISRTNVKIQDKKCDLRNEILRQRQDIKTLQNQNQQLQIAVENQQKSNSALMKKSQELQIELENHNQQLDIKQRNNAALIKKKSRTTNRNTRV